MKKLLAILLALTIIGGAAFAQITFSGYERGKLTATAGSLAFANRVRINFDVKDADGKYGAWGRFQINEASALTVNYAYAWATLADKKIKVTAGILGNYDYDLSSGSASDFAATGNVSNDMVALDSTKGALIQFLPVEGLNIGVTVVPTTTAIGLGNFGFNVKYDIKDVGAFVVTSMLNDTVENSAASVSFNFTGVKDLGVSAGFKYGEGIGYKTAVAKDMGLYGIVDYSMDALTLQVAGEYNLTASDLYVEGFVDYAIGSFTARGVGGYESVGTANLGNTYWLGAEGLYKVGKATLMAGFYYGDVDSWSVPLSVKVAF